MEWRVAFSISAGVRLRFFPPGMVGLISKSEEQRRDQMGLRVALGSAIDT